MGEAVLAKHFLHFFTPFSKSRDPGGSFFCCAFLDSVFNELVMIEARP